MTSKTKETKIEKYKRRQRLRSAQELRVARNKNRKAAFKLRRKVVVPDAQEL